MPVSGQFSAHDSAHDSAMILDKIEIIVLNIEGDIDREVLQSKIGIKHRTYFRNNFIKPALENGYIEFTLPNEKQSKNQKYRLTAKGIALKEQLKNK